MAGRQSSTSPLQRCNSMDSLQSSPNVEGYIFFDPMNFSQCMPAKSDKVWFVEKKPKVSFGSRIPQRKARAPKNNKAAASPAPLAKKILRGKNEEQGSEQEKELPAKFQQPHENVQLKSAKAENAEGNDSEKIIPAESNSTEKIEGKPPKQAVPKESLQENSDNVQTMTAGLCLGGEKTSETVLNDAHETESVDQAAVNIAANEDSKTENGGAHPADLPSFEWDEIHESSLKTVLQIQESRLEREKRTIESLKDKLGSCQEENFQLKNEILALQKAMTQREYAIEHMKTTIDDLTRDRDDMMSEMSVSNLRIQHKVGCLVSEISKLEKREKITLGLLKEASGDDDQAFENAVKAVDQSSDLTQRWENLKESLSNKENTIARLKYKLADVMERISAEEPETGADKESLKKRNKFLEKKLKELTMERDGVREEYQTSLDEWANFHQLMEEQHGQLCDTLGRVKEEKGGLESELSDTKKVVEQKSSDIEKYEELMARRESEVFESKKALKKYQLEMQRSLGEMEEEIQVIRKQNDESYDLLGIATSDLKILRERKKELEEVCNEKDLEREGSARALNELKLSDGNLKVANAQLEKKYSKVSSDVGGLTQRCDKLARINAELEDNLSMLSEKHEAAILDNHRLYDELEVDLAKLKDHSEKLEESKKEKAELEEISRDLREEKRALVVEVDELKVSLQLTQHERAEKLVEGAESHEDMLKSEVEKLSEELRKRDWELLNYQQATETRDMNKDKEMTRNYEQLNSDLQEIIRELGDCKAVGVKDAQSFGDKITVLEAEKAKLSAQLKDKKQTEECLRNMIQELQDDLVEQEERFGENSISILQETEEAKKRIANVEIHFKEQLAAKDIEIQNLQEIGNNLGDNLGEFQQVVCELQRRERCLNKENVLLKRKKKSLNIKFEKARKVEKCLNKKLEISEDKLCTLQGLRSGENGVNEVEMSLNKMIENTTRDLDEAKKENFYLKNQVEKQSNDAKKKEEKYNGMKEVVDSLKKFSAQETEKCNELIKDLAFEKEKQTSLEDKADTYFTKMNELHDELRAGELQCSDFKRRYEDAEKLCSELQPKLKDLQMKCESLTKEFGDKENLQEKTRSELLKLRVEYDNCQKQIQEKESESEKNSLQCQLKSFVASQNNDLIMEVRKSHSNVMDALHENKMGEMRNELIEMKRKGVLRREMAMTAIGSKSCASIRCS